MPTDDWRSHPGLQGRFHPDFPDDLQVIVHDGHPMVTGRGAELMWVRMNSCEADVPVFARNSLAVFTGAVLNKPHALQSVCEGSVIRFVVPQSGPHPLHVTERYLEERGSWRMLAVCGKCQMSELFDAPSVLVKHSFPALAADQLRGFIFTTRCGWCGGGQVVRLIRKRIE